MRQIRLLALILCALVIGNTANAQDVSDEDRLSVWVEASAKDILTLDFGNYDKKMAANKIYFTDYGYKHFSKALKNARYRDGIVTKKRMLTTTVLCPPKIELTDAKDWMAGKPNNVWQAEFQIELVWVDGKRQKTDYQTIQAVISDQNSANPDHFGIEQWIGWPTEDNKKPDCAKNT